MLFGWKILVNSLHRLDGAVRVHRSKSGAAIVTFMNDDTWDHVLMAVEMWGKRWRGKQNSHQSTNCFHAVEWLQLAIWLVKICNHTSSKWYFSSHPWTPRGERMTAARLLLSFNLYFWRLIYSRACTKLKRILHWPVKLRKPTSNSSVILR